MAAAWRREPEGLETTLRANRPEPSTELLGSLSLRIEEGNRRSRLYSLSRLSFAGALTVLMLGTLGAFGGVGYAASGTKAVVDVVQRAVAPSKPQAVDGSAAQDQYVQRVTICHRTSSGRSVTITVSENAVPAHLAHGDTLGPCPGGVAGAGATRTTGGSSLGAAGSQGTLPFTGLALGGTLGLSLLLIGTGVALRRRAGRDTTGE